MLFPNHLKKTKQANDFRHISNQSFYVVKPRLKKKVWMLPTVPQITNDPTISYYLITNTVRNSADALITNCHRGLMQA